eukprot:6979107-Prymnesium_polylepis.2
MATTAHSARMAERDIAAPLDWRSCGGTSKKTLNAAELHFCTVSMCRTQANMGAWPMAENPEGVWALLPCFAAWAA